MYKYNLILKTFTLEITRKGLLSKIKHLANKRIEEVAAKGLEYASEEELTHLFYCPQCMAKWYSASGHSRKPKRKRNAYAAK